MGCVLLVAACAAWITGMALGVSSVASACFGDFAKAAFLAVWMIFSIRIGNNIFDAYSQRK